MKSFTLKAVAVAVGALVGGSVMAAAVNLDAAAPVSIKYASERVITTNLDLRDGAAADQTATVALGASLGVDVAAYVRLDLVGGTFNGTPVAAMFVVTGSVGLASVNVAQTGVGYVIFSVTPLPGENLVGTNVATIDTDTGTATGIRVTGKTGVTMQYRMFETLTAAANPTALNTLKDAGAKPYAAFKAALTSTVTALTATADVAAVPSYTTFTGAAATKSVAKVEIAVDAAVALASGAASTAAGLLAATSDVTFSGDFNLARNDALTFTGAALARVFLYDAEACTGGANTVGSATTLTAGTATFTDVAAATLVATHYLCLTAEGTPEIAPSSYTASVDYVEQTDYVVADVAAAAAGQVVRNGVRMVAPLINQPTGWFSRLVLTNTGSSARDYSISYLTEDGTTVVATGAGSSGSLAAGKTTLINLPDVLTITPGAGLGVRASVVVTVNAPQSAIDGLYQIVSPTGTSIANYVLVYK